LRTLDDTAELTIADQSPLRWCRVMSLLIARIAGRRLDLVPIGRLATWMPRFSPVFLRVAYSVDNAGRAAYRFR